jgi:hypothetical protein
MLGDIIGGLACGDRIIRREFRNLKNAIGWTILSSEWLD